MISISFSYEEARTLEAVIQHARDCELMQNDGDVPEYGKIPDDYHLRELQERIEAMRLRQ